LGVAQLVKVLTAALSPLVAKSRNQTASEPIVRPLRVLSNTRWFEGRTFRGRAIESTTFRGGLLAMIPQFLAARGWDAVVFNVDERRLLTFCLLRRILGAGRCRLVSVDIHLPPLRTARFRRRARFLSWLLHEVDVFVCYFKETQPMCQAYGLERKRFVYVPFKVNTPDAIRAVESTDEGFALVCGRSDRDYRTLAAAADGLDVPIVVLVGPDHAKHGADVAEVRMPANVRVEIDDGSIESWIQWIARARFVILPVLPDVLKPSGISAYLQAMALGKCVITTQSPASQGLIDGGQAVLVNPGDPAALRDAIRRVANDAEYRGRIAAAGRTYAWSLGGEERLADDIVQCVGALVDGPRSPHARLTTA
jgi:glycosyltransferase involved in cell wall biosynthesis